MTGDVTFSTHRDSLGRVEVFIDRADPVSRIAEDLLEKIRNGDGGYSVELSGDVLTMRGANRTVVYRVGEYDPLTRTYEIRWPD